MPLRSAHPCGHPGCRALVRGKPRCPDHTTLKDEQRGTSNERGYDATWRRLREQHLRRNRACVGVIEGQRRPCGEWATDVDHIVSVRDAPERRLDPTNLRSLCHSCHSRRTALDQSGWGKGRAEG
jgi:5-methylcytosine-specific restriction protein A